MSLGFIINLSVKNSHYGSFLIFKDSSTSRLKVNYRYRILIHKRNCNKSRETGQLAPKTTHFPWPTFLRCFAIILNFLHLALENICLKYKKYMAWLFSLLILPKRAIYRLQNSNNWQLISSQKQVRICYVTFTARFSTSRFTSFGHKMS